MLPRLKKLATLLERRDKLQLAGLLGLMFIGAFLDMAGVGAVPAFVAALAIPERVMEYPALASLLERLGITTGRQLIIWGALALIVVFLLKNLFLIALNYVYIRTTERYRVRLSDRLFSAYMRAPFEFHLSRNTAELLRNVNTEASRVIQYVIVGLLSATLATLMTVFIVALLIVATPWIALVGIAIIGGGSWLFLRATRGKVDRYGEVALLQRRNGIKAVNQGLGGLQDARILGREHYFISAFRESIEQYALADRWKEFVSKTTVPVLEFVAVAGLLLIVFILVLTGSDLGTLMPMVALFGAAIVRLRATISTIAGSITQIRYSIVGVDPVFNDLQLLEGAGHARPARPAPAGERSVKRLPMRRAIQVENVSYAYPGTAAPVLRDIHLTIEKGSSVAFVGSTGSGKTTLVNVLLGLLKPEQGRVTVDGVDIQDHLRPWRANVGYIPQAIYLLDDTIRRNVAFGLGDEEIDEGQLWTALRAAQLEDFVRTLPDGAETIVGERGIRLSGGQRQRIGLARALYSNPEVLVMDEATSSLDNETERLVMQALDELKDGRTFIIIAHRLSTVRKCERLYFLKDGRVEAAGTYDELNQMHNEFRQMAEIA